MECAGYHFKVLILQGVDMLGRNKAAWLYENVDLVKPDIAQISTTKTRPEGEVADEVTLVERLLETGERS
jgi:hypothetical protein